jgi:hypothetical protein
MPLRDHFHPPLSDRKSWPGVHSQWLSMIVLRLNGTVLSSEFEAEPEVHPGTALSIDVATYEEDDGPTEFGPNGVNGVGPNGGVATAVQPYAPPFPPITGDVSITDVDTFEIQVYRNTGGWKLVAAIELVSPRNKDRPSARRAFATKVASYLQQGVSVVVVDVVTERQANLHAELVELLHLPDTFDWQSPTNLSAVTYRVVRVKVGDKEQERLDVWPFPLTPGEPLPTVPLWLNPVLAVPLELELTYANACQSLRIE